MTQQTFGLMSDLHMEFAPWSFEPDAGVFYLCAGDIDSARGRRHKFVSDHEDIMLAIRGNHDYYGGEFTGHSKIETEVNGFKIAAATLWTNLSNPQDWFNYVNGLVDSRFIKDLKFKYDEYNEVHQEHKEFLLNSGADIIMSHHTPSFQSVGDMFINSPLNPAFCSNLDEEILNMKHPPKIWLCGHVHHKHDYWIGETHVICNPRGYPGENFLIGDPGSYKPELVTLEK